MGLIGYTCSYIPVEILGATGHRPYRLLHGDPRLSAGSDRWLRVDACPLVRSNLSFVLRERKDFAAIVGSTGCDMARRLLEVVKETTEIPVFVVNLPRTDRPDIYFDEIDDLLGFLKRIDERRLKEEVEKWEGWRDYFRELSGKRSRFPSQLSTRTLQRMVTGYHKGEPRTDDFDPEPSDLPRVILLGSPLAYESGPLFGLIESSVRIVWDFNCGISRFIEVKIENHNLDGIKKAYYNQPPCILRRTNQDYYDSVKRRLARLKPEGIIVLTLDYCDSYEFELNRMRRVFDLPFLHLRHDFSFQNWGQLRTRLEAFKEMLV